MPAKTGDGYDVAACQKWFDAKRGLTTTDGKSDYSGDGLPPKVVAETLKILEQYEITKLKRKKLQDSILDRDETLNKLRGLLIRVRDRLQASPEEIAVELPPDIRDEMRGRMEDKVAGILTEMVQWFQRNYQSTIS